MAMMKPWRSPPPAGPDEFDCVWCDGGTDTLNVRVEINPADNDESGPIPATAELWGVWTGDMFLSADYLDRAFVDQLCIHAMKVYSGQIKMAVADYSIDCRIAQLEAA